MSVDDTLRESFEKQIGETVEVATKAGKLKLAITGVKDGKIQYYVKRGRANITKEIPLDAITDQERTKRAGKDLNGLALSVGVNAIQQQKYKIAETYFDLLPEPIRNDLLAKTTEYSNAHIVDMVSTELARSLHMAGVQVNSKTDFKQNLALLKKTDLSLGMRMLLHGAARDAWRQTRHTKWIEGSDLRTLLKYMMDLKPADADWEAAKPEADEDAPATAAGADGVPADNDLKVDPNIDWRSKIDF
jgi:hypothetical protein